MSFNILDGAPAPLSFFEDAKAFGTLPEDKLKGLIEFSIYATEQRIAITSEVFKERTSVSINEGYPAYRFAVNVIRAYATHTEQEILEDLRKLDFAEDRCRILLDLLRASKESLRGFWSKSRSEAVPAFNEMNWRVDVRVSSSDYLKGKEAVALVRIQASDGDERSQVYFELDREALSVLETSFNRLKEEFLEAERAISKEQTHE